MSGFSFQTAVAAAATKPGGVPSLILPMRLARKLIFMVLSKLVHSAYDQSLLHAKRLSSIIESLNWDPTHLRDMNQLGEGTWKKLSMTLVFQVLYQFWS